MLPPAVHQAALVEIIDQHFAHVAPRIDHHALDTVAVANLAQAGGEPLQGG